MSSSTMAIQAPDAAILLGAMMRIVSACMIMPIIGHRSVPMLARIGLAAALAWLLASAGALPGRAPDNLGSFLLGLCGETLLGVLLGFGASLAFWALTMAGEFVGLQMGLNFGSTMHMSFENSGAATGTFYTIVGSLVFLAIKGHHLLLLAVARTFEAAPLFALSPACINVDYLVTLSSSFFTAALQLALPAVGTLLLIEIALAFLSRVLPQLNAWIFGMPVKLAAGLLALWISLPAIMLLFQRLLNGAAANMIGVVK